MALDRSWVNALLDDDGSNLVGELWDKADVLHIYDDVDLELARLDAANLASVPAANADSGTKNDWALGLTAPATVTRWNGAADLVVTGLANGVAGRRWTFKNTGTKNAYFAHSSSSSAAANRFTNAATSAATPVAPGGWATYEHDGSAWQLVAHEQGAWVAHPFNAANFATDSGSWTVASGNVSQFRYVLRGKTLFVSVVLTGTTIGGSPAILSITVPGGFTQSQFNNGVAPYFNNSAYGVATIENHFTLPTVIRVLKQMAASAVFTAGPLALDFQIGIEVN